MAIGMNGRGRLDPHGGGPTFMVPDILYVPSLFHKAFRETFRETSHEAFRKTLRQTFCEAFHKAMESGLQRYVGQQPY